MAASELTLESDCLELCSWTVAFKTIFSKSSRSVTPALPFEPRFRMFIINGYYTKSKRL